MSRITTHQYTIQQAFRECFYVVPDYQREYVWTHKEVRQLLNDIDEQLGDGGDATSAFFVGTVLVSERKGEQDHFDVIDGQQRLTTFFLLLCALKQRFRGEPQAGMIEGLISTSYVDSKGEACATLKLEPRYENAIEVMQRIVQLDADAETTRQAIEVSGIQTFGSLKNLLAAYREVQAFLGENYTESDNLKRFWGFLANQVVFIQISTDVSSALKIFETINERGVGLNPMDLLKNLLFTQVRDSEFAQLKEAWARITGPLERQQEKPLRFLRYFLMANYPIQAPQGEKSNSRAWGEGILREDDIYEWFIDAANADVTEYRGEPFVFVRKIEQNLGNYLNFVAGRGNDGQASLEMENLRLLGGSAFRMHVVLLLAAARFPKELFDHFLRQLETFVFTFLFTKAQAKDLERVLSAWAGELRAVAAETDHEKQRIFYNRFVTSRLGIWVGERRGRLEDALRRYNSGSMQKYRTRYLLAKLAQHVDLAFTGVKTPGSLMQFTKMEIEHILPNTPEPELRTSFEAAGEEGEDVRYHDYKNRLGNLTLLEKPINVVAGNDFYAQKLVLYEESGIYLTRSLSSLAEVGKNTSVTRINERLRSFTLWTPEAIRARQDLLVALSGEVWRIEEA